MKKFPLSQLLMGALITFTFLLSGSAHAITEAAKVNDKVISLEEVNQKLLEATHANPLAAPTKKRVLDDLIKREVAVQEAKKAKLDQDPAVMDRINTVLFYAYIEKKLGADFDKMTISDSEAKSWYEKNPEVRTSQIFIALPPEATADEEKTASKKLSEIMSEIKSGKMSFAEAAQKSSEDPSASIGGDLDYRMKDRLEANYYKAATKLGKSGDMTGPVRTSFGMHLIRLTGKHAWTEVDRMRVKKLMLDEKRQELVGNLLNDLRHKAKVTVNEKVIKE